MWGVFYWVCSTFVNYLIITTVVDILLMGRLHIRYSRRCAQRHFMMEGQNRIDFQTKYECSAFASAYLLRHHGREERLALPREELQWTLDCVLGTPPPLPGFRTLLSEVCML